MNRVKVDPNDVRWYEKAGCDVCLDVRKLRELNDPDAWLAALDYARDHGGMPAKVEEIERALDTWYKEGGRDTVVNVRDQWRERAKNSTDDELKKWRNSLAVGTNERRFVQAHFAARQPRALTKRAEQGKDTHPTEAVNLKISRAMKRRVERAALVCDTTVSGFVRMAIENELAEVLKK